jgi:AcrR family transcriptional regulator
MLDAFAVVVAERGYWDTTTSAVARRAGVPEATLLGSFGDKAGCLLAAYDSAEGELVSLIASAAGRSRIERFEQGLLAFLRFCSRKPEVARMGLVELDAVGAPGIARRLETIEGIARLVERTLVERSDASSRSVTAHMIVGGVRYVVANRVAHGQTAHLPGLAPELMQALHPVIRGWSGGASPRGLDRPQ